MLHHTKLTPAEDTSSHTPTTNMSYTLFVWAVIAMAGDRHYAHKEYGYKPLAKFHDSAIPPQQALEKCQQAARQLGLKEYQCTRTK